MPFLNSADVTALSGTEDRLANVPAAPTQPQDTPAAPSAMDTLAAGFRSSNVVTSLYDRFQNPDSSAPAVPGYDPSLDIHGYENQSDRFLRSTSPAQTQVIKSRIDAENATNATLARAGGWGTAASIAGGILDPVTIASMAIPVAPELAGASRLARIGVGVGATVAAGEAQQYALNTAQGTDYTPSALRIGGNAILAGVLGGFLTRVPRGEVDALADRVGAEVNRPPSESTAGAQQVPEGDTSIARGGQFISDTLNRTSPMARVMNSDNAEARKLALQLTETPAATKANEAGIATPPSIEIKVQQLRDQRDFALTQEIDHQFLDYKQGTDAPMNRPQFVEAVTDAMRNGDIHEIPQVAKVANQLRPVFNIDRSALQKLGALPEEFELTGAKGYVPRVYNTRAILQNRQALEDTLFDHFTENPKIDEDGLPIQREPAEVKDAVHSTMDNILGSVRNTADIGTGLRNPSSMKARSLDVPDDVLRPWLSNDIEHVYHGYNQSILPQIEMRKQFGTTDFQQLTSKTMDEYHRMQEGAASTAAKKSLTQSHGATMRDLEHLHQAALNQAGARVDAAHSLVRFSRLAMTYNYLREMGGPVLSAIPDVARMVGQFGLYRTFARTARLITSGGARDLAHTDAQRMGTALDTALHTRAKSLGELATEPGGSSKEQWAQNIANRFTNFTLMAPYDESLRTITASLMQDNIARAVKNGKLSASERMKLAAHGIGDAEMPAIREQWAKYGSKENGLERARTELWDDQDAAKTVERAVVTAASRVAFHIGRGDLPLLMSNPLWQMIMQFKSFSLTAAGRVLTPLAQGVAHGDIKAYSGVAAAVALGDLAYVMKEVASGNNKPDLSPATLAREGISNSGLLAWLPDLYDTMAGVVGMPTLSRYGNRSISESFSGPVIGTLDTLATTIHHMTHHQVSAQDIHRLRQLMPFQNIWFLRRLIDAGEGKAADALNVKDATHRSFTQDVLQDRTDQPKKERAL